MPTILLTLLLFLSGGDSCATHSKKNTPRISSQSDVSLLNPLIEQVESSDEPTLRIFLRLKIATYLWRSSSDPRKPESIVMAALSDLRAHEKEIPALYVNLFRRELLAQLKTHAPDVAARLTDEYKPDRRTDLDVAYSMLGQGNGADKAVGIVERSIAGGKDPGSIIVPFLQRLEKVNPAGVPKVLAVIMSTEESHPGSISAGTLFILKHLFISEETSPSLQRRYLAAVINRAGDMEASPASVVDTYTILVAVLPTVEKLAPDLYGLAGARLSQLAGRVPGRTLERIAIDKRVRQSSDPLSQLLVESEAASDSSLREDLQTEAAQLALGQGRTQIAIELAIKLQPKNPTASLWRDQFIEGAVERSLNEGNPEVARYGARHIQSVTVRLSTLQKIALHLQASGDLEGARDTLSSALKLIEASEDSADKAAGLLDLAGSFMKVDSQRAPELLRAAVKTINKTPAVMRRAQAGSDTHSGDVENMMKIAYRIIPAFQAFGAVDQSAALALTEDIQRQELRIAAKVGARTSPPAPGKNTKGIASN